MTGLYSMNEAAEYLGISRTAVRHRVKAGTLQPAKAVHHPNRVEFWFNQTALDFSQANSRRGPRVSTHPHDVTVLEAVRGMHRGAPMSDEENARSFQRWLESRRARQLPGGASTRT